jgi:hypothetical protein
MIEPAADFCEYYVNTIEKLQNLLKAKNLVDSFSDEEIDDIMEAFDDMRSNGSTIH